SYLSSSAGRGGGEGDGLGGADRPPRRPSSAGCLRGRECTVTLAGQHPAATEAGSRDGGAFGRRLPPRASGGWRAVTRSLLSGIDAHNPPPEASSRGGQARLARQRLATADRQPLSVCAIILCVSEIPE